MDAVRHWAEMAMMGNMGGRTILFVLVPIVALTCIAARWDR